MPSVPTTPPSPGGLRGALQALVRELAKFGTVGAVAFAVDTLLYGVLLRAGVETILAKTLATVVSTTVAFGGHRFWTWRHRVHHHMGRQYALFFLFNAAGLGISLAVLGAVHYGLGAFWPVLATDAADIVSGSILGNALATLFRFWAYRRFVFRAGADPAPPAPAAATPETRPAA